MKINGEKKKDKFSGSFCTVGYCAGAQPMCCAEICSEKLFSCSKSADQANILLRVGTSGPRKINLVPRTLLYLQLQIAD